MQTDLYYTAFLTPKQLLEKLLALTPRLQAPPKVYGAFHICSLAIVLLICMVMLVLHFKASKSPTGRTSNKDGSLKISLLVFFLILFLSELGKQLIFSYDTATEAWKYCFEKFPFQLCSTPIYISLAAYLLPGKGIPGRIRDALICFLGTYSAIAGASVLFYPSPDVFSEIIYLDIHTMLWHGIMLIYGLYLWLAGFVKPEISTAFKGLAVFLPLNFIALALNEIEHLTGFAGGEYFNMFYISRYYTCGIPVLHEIQKTMPYPVFFAAFILTLSIASFAVVLLMMLISKKASGFLNRLKNDNNCNSNCNNR